MSADTCISCGEQIPEGRQVCPGCEKRQWIKITVPGRPVPKGRPRFGVRGKKAYVYTPTETKEYEKLVGWFAKSAGCRPTDKPVIVSLDMYTRRKMDLDNVAKSILDSLNGVAYKDDDQVVELLVRKFQVKHKTEERVEIEILKADQNMVLDDLDLIDDIVPDYSLGRRRGLTDEETEKRARRALAWITDHI